MKKIKHLFVLLISIFAFKINVYAASGSLSVSSGNIYVGDSFTVTANISSAASWNVHVSASGPVSGCSINQADASADAMDTNKSFSATCTSTGTGTITVTLSGDVTSASDGEAVILSGSRSVTVSNRPEQPSNNGNNDNNNNSNNNSNNYSNDNYKEDTRSKNNNIKELSVDGYKLEKVDDNNYSLTVPNDVSNINIKASSEDSKASVTGDGKHDLNVGNNNIEIVVTSENGSQNKINIKVNRKDGFYLDDLDSLLKKDNVDNLNIIIKSDSKITKDDLTKIKKSKKTVNFNFYNDDKLLVYSLIVDGSKIKNESDFLITIVNDSDNKKEILRLSNYADGIYLGVKDSNKLPKGTQIKLYVGNKYDDKDVVNVYSYTRNNDQLMLVKNKIKVEKGYIQFKVSDSSEYFITMSTITNSDNSSNVLSNILLFVVLILILILVVCFVFIIKKPHNTKSSKKNKNSKVKNVDKTLNDKSIDKDLI